MNNVATVSAPRAYLLMRSDLPSLGRGKSYAHAMHAGNHMTSALVVSPLMNGEQPSADVIQWHNEGGGFGTTISLGKPGQITLNLIDSLTRAAEMCGIKAGKVIDKEYPYLVDEEIYPLIDEQAHTAPAMKVRDGWICFRVETTAAWFLGTKEQLDPILARFDLTPND